MMGYRMAAAGRDEDLDLLTPNERIIRARHRKRALFSTRPSSASKVAGAITSPDASLAGTGGGFRRGVVEVGETKKVQDDRMWWDVYRRAALEEERQAKFGRFKGGELFHCNRTTVLIPFSRLILEMHELKADKIFRKIIVMEKIGQIFGSIFPLYDEIA